MNWPGFMKCSIANMPKSEVVKLGIEEDETSTKRFHWENLSNGFFLFPLIIWAVFRTLKSGTIWTLSAANPGLTFGGFFGFAKTEAYDVLPPESYPTTVLIKPEHKFKQVLENIKGSELKYPFVVKPNGGMVGLLVRVINNEAQLKRYYDLVKIDWMAQAMINYDTEIGVFYVRHPKSKKGKIVGLSQKLPLSVIGDGKATVGELVKASDKTSQWEEMIFAKQEKNWNKIPANGEFFQLIFTTNRKNGAQLVEMINKVDDELVTLFDGFSNYKDGIFYGRYDIKCESLESLRKGENYSILEFNGVHSGYGHLYHCGKSAKEVYKGIHALWNELYDLSAANNKNGTPYISFLKGVKFIYASLRDFRKMSKWEKELQ